MQANEFFLHLKKLTVRVRSKDGLSGSGIIYWPANLKETFCYVITAKHCLLGEHFDNGAVAKETSIDHLYTETAWERYELTEADDLIYPENPALDIALMKIPKSVLQDRVDEVPTIKFIVDGDHRLPCLLRGFPRFTDHEEVRTIDGYLVHADGGENTFHVKSADDFRHALGTKPVDLLKGLSGSGVCVQIDHDIYLYGITGAYEAASNRFVCTSILPVQEQFFSDTALHYYQVEKVISEKWFTRQLKTSSKNLGPRFTQTHHYPVSLETELGILGRNDLFQQLMTEQFSAQQLSLNRVIIWLKQNSRDMVKLERKKVDKNKFPLQKTVILRTLLNQYQDVFQSYLKNFLQCGYQNTSDVAVDALVLNIKEIRAQTDLLKNCLPVLAQTELKRYPELPKKIDALIELIKQANTAVDVCNDFLLDKQSLLNAPYLLITSKAGNGKSQLLAYTANQRALEGRPSVLVLGQRLTRSNDLWGQLLKDLELTCDTTQFLTALNLKAASLQKRAIIFIDAVNEGQGIQLWHQNFEAFCQTVSAYPWIKIVFSCRTTFKPAVFRDIVIPADLELEHLGFLGKEEEAMQFFFFEIFHINPKNADVLIHEFSNPLFLKLFCLACQTGEFTGDLASSAGMLWIIDKFLTYVNELLALPEKFDYRSERINLVKKAVEAIIIKIVGDRTHQIDYETAFLLTEQTVHQFLNKKGFINGLIDEEVFYENIKAGTDHGAPEVVLDISYEKLGDHLKVHHMLNGLKERDLRDELLPDGSLYRYFGENKNTGEYAGLLEAFAIQVRERFNKDIFTLVPSIVHYEGSKSAYMMSISNSPQGEPSVKLLRYVHTQLSSSRPLREAFWDQVLPNAANSRLHFNADWLHELLKPMSLAERDHRWTTYLQYRYSGQQEQSAISTLIPQHAQASEKIDQKTLMLLGTALTWFLGSTNRGLRDDATKGLVLLFSDRLEQIRDLLIKFKDINDPYIRQRLMAAAYGAASRTTEDGLPELCKYIFDQVFDQSMVLADVLYRDYARNTIEYGLYKQQFALSPDQLQKIRPPYRSENFANFPTNRAIDRLIPPEGHSGTALIKSSMVTEYGRENGGYGDFGRYVFGSAVRHWRVDEAGLSNLAVQTIIRQYGYSNKLHGDFDLQERRGRRDYANSKLERIGKKYQWMVFHQFLARLGDNYDFYESGSRIREGEKPGTFEGPWQPMVRDIDPTLAGSAPEVNKNTYWHRSEKSIEFIIDLNRWINGSLKTHPEAEELLEFTDHEGESWVALESHPVWTQDKTHPHPQEIWLQVRSYLVERTVADEMTKWIKHQNFMGRWMPEGGSWYQVFNREFYWAPAAKYFQGTSEEGKDWKNIYEQGDQKKLDKVAPTALEYRWESSNDYSLYNAVNILKPARLIEEILRLTQGPGDGEFVDVNGRVICFDPSVTGDGFPGLLVRKEELLKALKEHRLSILWTILGEKGDRPDAFTEHTEVGPRIELTGFVTERNGELVLEINPVFAEGEDSRLDFLLNHYKNSKMFELLFREHDIVTETKRRQHEHETAYTYLMSKLRSDQLLMDRKDKMIELSELGRKLKKVLWG